MVEDAEASTTLEDARATGKKKRLFGEHLNVLGLTAEKVHTRLRRQIGHEGRGARVLFREVSACEWGERDAEKRNVISGKGKPGLQRCACVCYALALQIASGFLFRVTKQSVSPSSLAHAVLGSGFSFGVRA